MTELMEIVQCIQHANKRRFRPLAKNGYRVDQFLADHHSATVQDLFQMVDVFEFLTIHHAAAEEHHKLNNPQD